MIAPPKKSIVKPVPKSGCFIIKKVGSKTNKKGKVKQFVALSNIAHESDQQLLLLMRRQ